MIRNTVIAEGLWRKTAVSASMRESPDLALSLGQPLLLRDVRTDPCYLSALDTVRTELAAPMLLEGNLVGIIDLQRFYAGRVSTSNLDESAQFIARLSTYRHRCSSISHSYFVGFSTVTSKCE
jgi:GAF domain-containing protein